jgi:fatty acyl-CoA reductase
MIRKIGYTNFFKDKTILVTGGPGFMGKSIIEKFIRCLPFKKMYLIIRKKKNKTPEWRLHNEVLNDMCFYRVKTTVKNYKSIVKNKLVAVHGDIS